LACAHHSSFETTARSAAGLAPTPVRSVFQRVRDRLRTWLERDRQRRALAELSDHLLRDIGVTRAEAMREAAKPFWVSETKHD
jgi:uncharacterized protein YjiS (DUF1127 family)